MKRVRTSRFARSPWRQRARFAPRSAFTLLELLIALALIATVAMMTWPAIMRSTADYRLRRAAQEIRAALARTRAFAVESGVPYQFLYEPGGRRYVAIPAEREGLATPLGGVRSLTTSTDDLERTSGSLPEQMTFQGSTDRTSVQRLQPELFAGLSDAAELGGVSWASPIVFSEDGTTNDDTLSIADPQKSRSVELKVRGFTGVTSVGPVSMEVAL